MNSYFVDQGCMQFFRTGDYYGVARSQIGDGAQWLAITVAYQTASFGIVAYSPDAKRRGGRSAQPLPPAGLVAPGPP